MDHIWLGENKINLH